MRGMWAFLVVTACVLVGLIGAAGAIVISRAGPVSDRPALVQPGQAGSQWLSRLGLDRLGLGQPGRLPAPAEPDQAATRPLPDQAATHTLPDRPAVPRTSTATRHVRTPEEALASGDLHPATDRVMALLVGWVLLASLGGGLLAPRH